MGDAAHPSGDPRPAFDYREVEDSARFRELKREHRSFVFPLAVAFLVWYFAFVLLSDYAHEFMSTPVIGNVNLGILLGLGQFVTTFAITTWYVSRANSRFDPIAAEIRADLEERERVALEGPRGSTPPKRRKGGRR